MEKSRLFLFLIALCSVASLAAQCPANASFTTQLSIDTFPGSHPGCSAIPGNVYIGGANVSNLDSLASIVSIGGNLQIASTSLPNLLGLSNLTALGGELEIIFNPQLTSLDGLQGISVVHSNLKIGSQALTSLTGLNNLTTVGGHLTFDGNVSLTSLSALSNLDSVGSNISFYGNHGLTSLAGLENITVIHGALNMVYNNSIASLTGLNNLTRTDGGILISAHPVLANLLALSNLNHIGNGLSIGGSPLLTSLAGLDSVHYFAGNLSIYTNANLVSLAALGNINSLGNTLSIGISGNTLLPNLTGLESFTTCTQVVIDNNPSLTSLTGLQNITSIWLGGLVIDNNDALTSLSGLSGLTGNIGCRIDNNATLASLDGLQGLTSIGGYIRYNPALTSLTGLNNVMTISSLYIVSNNALTNLSGLNSVTNVLTVLAVQYNNSLVNFMGLGNLATVREIWVQNNNALQNFSGLTSLTTVGTLLIENNNALASLNGLQSLTGGTPSLKADLSIKINHALTSLAALENFKSNINTITIINNDDLPNLIGLDSVASVNSLTINDNGSLSSLAGLEHLATIVNFLSINSNPLLVNLSDLSGLATLCTPTSGYLSIQLNGQLEDASEPAICAYLNGSGYRVIANNYYGALNVAEVIADCNGQMLTWYRDADGDIYGNANDHRRAVDQPTGFVADDTDCNDSNANIHPGASEICGNLVDENCNGYFSEPMTLSLTSTTDASCNGNADGAVNISTVCGKSPFTFLWSNGATTEDLVNAAAGTYTLTATDSQGLTATLSASISQSTGYTLNVGKTNISCAGDSNGALQANPSGLPTAYTFLWSTGATTRNISNLTAGVYTVTATKTSTGCTKVATTLLPNPLPIALTLTKTDVSCFGSSTGKAIVNSVSGGTGAKTFLWSNGTAANKILNQAAGTYSCTATDTKGCTASASVTINDPTQPLTLSYNIELLPNGKYRLTLQGNGGWGSYRYCKAAAFSSCNFSWIQSWSNLWPGTAYLCKVKDLMGCTVSQWVYLPDNQPTAADNRKASSLLTPSLKIRLLPNPFHHDLQLEIEHVVSDLTIQIFDPIARICRTIHASPSQMKSTLVKIDGTDDWLPGAYFLKIWQSKDPLNPVFVKGMKM